MAKKKAKKYYAVVGGKQGNKIYSTWEETEKNVKGIKKVQYKSFEKYSDAKQFIQTIRNKKKKPEKPATRAELMEKQENQREKDGLKPFYWNKKLTLLLNLIPLSAIEQKRDKYFRMILN